jgi:triosephosphate isomerase
MHVRRKLVAGNWKMNGGRAALAELTAIAAAARQASGVDVAICPPFTLVPLAVPRAGGIVIGAQDCHCEEQGAFTGNVSAPMLAEAGAKLVIVGHSERRAQGESDEFVRAKAETALRHGLTVIVCVGESDSDRESGRHFDVVAGQLLASLPDEVRSGELVVAYEPIWAIGTGKTATPDDVAAMHKRIRHSLVEGAAGPGVGGARIRILYGGSVNAGNAAALFAVEDVDGALVGGASLTAAQFVPIVEAAARS